MFGGKKAKELEEELLALQEKQNRLQEQISNIAKAKDSAEETLVQMTISKTELDETITAVSEELELLKECSEANSGQTVLLKQQLAKKNEQNIRLQQEKEALCQQMEGEHEKIAKVVEKNKYVTTPMKEIESFYEAYCQERESVEEALQRTGRYFTEYGSSGTRRSNRGRTHGRRRKKICDSGRGSACERRAVYFGGCGCACENQWF